MARKDVAQELEPLPQSRLVPLLFPQRHDGVREELESLTCIFITIFTKMSGLKAHFNEDPVTPPPERAEGNTFVSSDPRTPLDEKPVPFSRLVIVSFRSCC